jgi:hypothetical protein
MQQAAQAQQVGQAPPPQRPASSAIQGHFAGHLDQLVADGRLSEDQRHEFGNVIAEYMYDHQRTTNMINHAINMGAQRIAELEGQLTGQVLPDLQQRQQSDALAWENHVQQSLAAQPGYESLATPEEWNRLKLFIGEKVAASPRDHEGNPSFNPLFDVETMSRMYDAMMGPELRKQLEAQRAAQEQKSKEAAAMAGGETTARASTPPQQRQPSKMTPEDEAMDFSDPSMATG